MNRLATIGAMNKPTLDGLGLKVVDLPPERSLILM